MTIAELQEEIIDEFSVFGEWLDKYEYIREWGKERPQIEESCRDDSHLIDGCQSRVWLSCDNEAGRLRFRADSDAIITKGIISLLIKVFDGQTPADILAADLGFLDTIGLKENLSPTRAGGLVAMIERIRRYAADNLV